MQRPILPPALSEIMGSVTPEALQRVLISGVGPTQDGKYRHWDVLRHLAPPEGVSHELWWLAIKGARQSIRRQFPLVDREGRPFHYALPDVAHEMLHSIDKRATGAIKAPDQVTNPQTRDEYLIRSLMEEAIRSSQLEGAATTRRVAKEMLRSGRAPRDRNERMIANNYRAMRFIRERLADPLTSETLTELQRILTDGTMRDDGAVGRFRRPDDRIVVEDAAGEVLHVPPAAQELPARVKAMCDFANGATAGDSFLHPVVKAVLLHFWLAYDHPFCDGNGRTARALFYWSMARDGYWLSEFISISRIIHGAPARYARAFLYTETDDNDAAYFLLNQLRVINRAIDDLYEYLDRKASELQSTRGLLGRSGILPRLNSRQISLVQDALSRSGRVYTIASHQRAHRVSYQTARTDLLSLAELGLLERGRVGKAFAFNAPHDLRGRLHHSSSLEGPR